MTTPRERPILFSGPMVNAILEGRKTQTRRIIKQPRRADGCRLVPELFQQIGVGHSCPYGVPGDRLWVRETWAANAFLNLRKPSELRGESIYYRATYDNDSHFMWRPSIHMPRWASRILLEVTRVRVERLHDITEEDAIAEGIEPKEAGADGRPCWNVYGLEELGQVTRYPKWSYERLWGQINGPDSWAANPWVWVLDFRRVSE